MKKPGHHKKTAALQTRIRKFRDRRVLVVGDLMLDHYIWGRVERISPEAPVPVVSVSTESVHPGGAANVAHNIVSLGGQVDLVGVIGEDEFGRRLLHELKGIGIGTDGIIIDRSRPTTKKTRVIAHHQQVVRFDREEREPVSGKTLKRLLEKLSGFLPQASSVLISDYAKGVVTGDLMEALREGSTDQVPLIVDPKVPHMTLYQGADVITPNAGEAVGAAGLGDTGEANIRRAGKMLLEHLACRAVLITRGEQGMSLFTREGDVRNIPTAAREVFDVTGAGDTVVGTMALGLSAGASLEESAVLANYAAGIVVGTVGTATVSGKELLSFIREADGP